MNTAGELETLELFQVTQLTELVLKFLGWHHLDQAAKVYPGAHVKQGCLVLVKTLVCRHQSFIALEHFLGHLGQCAFFSIPAFTIWDILDDDDEHLIIDTEGHLVLG